LNKKWERGPTRIGCAVTKMTELATDVISREVIQRAKCAARISPMAIMRRRSKRGMVFSSVLVFLCSRIKGRRSKVVNNSR